MQGLVECIILEAETARRFGIRVDHRVALLKRVRNEVAKKGVEAGDIVLEVNGEEPLECDQIGDALIRGEKLKIYRKGEIITIP